ncbi:MAG: branched-chain amino acid ABC transporter permease [Lautropia sp.]
MTASLLASILVSGALNGGLYALLGLAIVLLTRTTAVANFAQGDMGMFSVFLLLMVFLPLGMPPWLGWVSTVLVSAALGGMIWWVLIRPRPQAGHLNLTIRTLGLYTLIYSVVNYLWGSNAPYTVPRIFPPGSSFELAGFSISNDQFGTAAVTVLIAGAFLAFFRFTRLGLAMRAVAIDPNVASLLGINVRRVVLAVWLMAGAIGAVVGLLIASLSFLDPNLMRPYILKAFTAAIMGGLYSFPGVIVGGIVLGIAEALAVVAISIHLREPFVFLVLLLVLLVRPGGIFGAARAARV